MGKVTHQRREKGVCHGEFLYLVFERKGPVSSSRQEPVLHFQLSQIGHNDPR